MEHLGSYEFTRKEERFINVVAGIQIPLHTTSDNCEPATIQQDH
jgi:hypothetical protein